MIVGLIEFNSICELSFFVVHLSKLESVSTVRKNLTRVFGVLILILIVTAYIGIAVKMSQSVTNDQ
jgi:predicted permease